MAELSAAQLAELQRAQGALPRKRWLVINTLTDNSLGVHEAATPGEAIDAAYRAAGWLDFADARAQKATAAEVHEIQAREVDGEGREVGPYFPYPDTPAGVRRLELFWFFVDTGKAVPWGEIVGYNAADFFKPGAYAEARRMIDNPDHGEAALDLLTRCYLGPDEDGIGLRWEIV